MVMSGGTRGEDGNGEGAENAIPFGRYGLVSRLGRGGMGEVFLAVARGAAGFRKKVVVKRILPELARDSGFVERFLAEGKLVVQLHHPNIVQVLDMGEEAGEVFIAMEYVDGWDLGHVLEMAQAAGRAMPLELVLLVLLGVAEALDYAHRATDDAGRPLGIVHRDVSPANIVLGRQGVVKLLDFGIAKVGIGRVADGGGGKYSYMAPEQAAPVGGAVAAGDGGVDARSDLFSFGIVAWELIAGAHPFRGYSEQQTLERICTADAGPVGRVGETVPDGLVGLVGQLLAKDPAGRPADAGEVARGLRQLAVASGRLAGAEELAAWLGGLEVAGGDGGGGLDVDALLGLGLGRAMVGVGRERTVTAAAGSVGFGGVGPGSAPAAVVPVEPAKPVEADAAARVVAGPGDGGARAGAGRRPGVLRRMWPVFLMLGALVGAAWLLWEMAVTGSEGQQRRLASPGGDVVDGAVVAVANVQDEPEGPEGPDAVDDGADGEFAVDSAEGARGDGVSGPSPALPEVVSSADAAVEADTAAEVGEVAESDGGVAQTAALVVLRIETEPADARVTVVGVGAGRAPFSVDVPLGGRVVVRAEADGHQARNQAVVVDGPKTMRLRLEALAAGRLRVRVLPATAVVVIDGRSVGALVGGVIDMPLAVGEHRLEATGPGGARVERVFRIEADTVTNLRTLEVGVGAKVP